MSLRLPAAVAVLTITLAPAAARADVSHLVTPGETLSGIAAVNGLSSQALAIANGLSPQAFVIAGRSLVIPPRGVAPVAPAGSAAAGSATPAPLGGYRVRLGDSLSKIAVEHGVSIAQLAAANGFDPSKLVVAGTSLRLPDGSAPATASSPATPGATAGSHEVVPGETLTGIAAANGITPAALAAANGLAPDAFVIAGTCLRIPSGAPAASVPATSPVVGSGPVATGGRLTAAQIGSIAGQNGAPASLATAIAWQESGFNNSMVSVANARGIMQVIPSTWDYVQRNLAADRLDPTSPTDNVRAGSLLLARLMRETGDPATAVAAYYQGLGSVRRIGMLPETRQYVANVLALRGRFGG
jgi:LysM repeat protein